MLYRTFGRTGLAMPVVSFGMMRCMHSWQDAPVEEIPDVQQNRLATLVDAAFSNGITHFETARGYGSSERQLARVLGEYDRHAYILQTKVRPKDDPELFVAHVLDSLDRLGQQRVDLLALHGINDHRDLWQACRPGGCLAAARRLQKEGKVDWVGFSGHGDPEVILSAVRHEGDGGFDYLNLHWYAIFQRNSPALVAAAERNMGVFIISPTDKGGRLQDPPEKLSGLSAPLTPIQFNDLFCLQRPQIHTISIGAARVGDFEDHLDILSLLEERETGREIMQRWEKAMEEVSGNPRPEGLWDKLPSWRDTPGYINIGFILWLYNLARGWDLLEFARGRYRMLGREMPWVAGNDAAQVNGYALADAAARAGVAEKELVRLLAEAHALLNENG